MTEQACMVCGKSFEKEVGMKWMHDGAWYVFNDLGCRNRFIGNPAKYLEAKTAG